MRQREREKVGKRERETQTDHKKESKEIQDQIDR